MSLKIQSSGYQALTLLRLSTLRRAHLPLATVLKSTLFIFFTIILPKPAQAVERADGFAKGVTGAGAAAVVVHPATLDDLKNALCSSFDQKGNCTDETPRVIGLDHAFDFRGTVILKGSPTTTEVGCVVNPCPQGGEQEAINGANEFCKSRHAVGVTYDNAGLQRLKVGSNKTLIGLGSHAGIKGMGLYIGGGAHNIIVRNLTLSDINPQVVWGGDALTIDGADGVWIDHNTFARIGRQMIVTGWGSASHVTLSSNEFDGRTPYSSSCDGHHYWVWLFLGHHDTISVARNYIHDTSGRAPHAGGMGDAEINAQLVNNVFSQVTYQGAIMSRTSSSHLLVEGNDFENVSHPLFNDTDQPGTVFAPFAAVSPSSNSVCQRALGRPCVANQQHHSGDDFRPLDTSALEALSSYSQYLIAPLTADAALAQVVREAGAGKVDFTLVGSK